MEQDDSLDSTAEYFKQLGKITQEIDRDEITRLWALAKKGNVEAKHQILQNNLRLVIPTAKRFLRPGMELMDLIEEGNLGLLQAINKFEPTKGYRFSTYAVYWIEQYIRKYIEEQAGSIKIPSHAWGNLKRWFRVWNELKEANGRDPSLNEMAQEMGLSARQVRSIMDTLSAAHGVDSLANVVYSEENMTLEDVLSDDGKGNPHEVFLQQENFNNIKQSMAELSDRDRQVVILRYGLDHEEPKTLGEVADLLSLSRERVRQIEERAIATLRREAQKAGIIDTLEREQRPRNLHSGIRLRVKTNILGEEKPNGALAKLLRQTMQKAVGTSSKKPTTRAKKSVPSSRKGSSKSNKVAKKQSSTTVRAKGKISSHKKTSLARAKNRPVKRVVRANTHKQRSAKK